MAACGLTGSRHLRLPLFRIYARDNLASARLRSSAQWLLARAGVGACELGRKKEQIGSTIFINSKISSGRAGLIGFAPPVKCASCASLIAFPMHGWNSMLRIYTVFLQWAPHAVLRAGTVTGPPQRRGGIC